MRLSPRMKLVTSSVLLCVLLGLQSAQADATTPPQEAGTWTEHRYSFVFMGFTSTYSCDGLADKLKLLLLTAGARADAKANPGACPSGFGQPDKFAQADLTFFTLVPSSEKPTSPVAGRWRSVALAARQPRELSVGDCELVEQFQANVLSMFTTRNLDNHTTCVPHQQSGSVINLKFEAFTAFLQPKAPEKAKR